MFSEQFVENFRYSLQDSLEKIVNLQTFFVFALAMAVAYLASRTLGWVMHRIARYLARAGEAARTSERIIQLRRIETYLSVMLALARLLIFAIALVIAWQVTHPQTTPAAFLTASTIFIVLAGATIVPMLRDVTTGSVMIAEQWYNVGDYIDVLPFGEVSGVVERMNLRSTKLRSLSGEIIWIHNQHIQGIKVTPNGVRTIAVEVFVNNLKKGEAMIAHLTQTLPVSPTMLATPFELVHTHKLNDKLWQITAIGQTAPGREWLIEKFALEAMEEYDKNDGKIIVHGPISRSADEIAERRFKRVVGGYKQTLHVNEPPKPKTSAKAK